MKKIILGLTTLVVSAGAFAGLETNHNERTLYAGVYSSQEQAYVAGFQKLDQLKALPSQKLANELLLQDAALQPKTLKIDSSEVQVQAFSLQRGTVQYRAIVKVDYQYQSRENRRG
ncbi:DUF3316 domain-containing protein [Vibrio metoecus]|uniref:DUF3316 domain-containing protein n=1 Tax=Vibrio metoecus TaxID=1481663 RepID=UPI001303039A|nr:DUF3316 domain-containing protein [Vibrio metoecus]